GALCVAPSSAAPAADYPSQTIKIVVPFTPGGGVDVVARLIAPRLSESLGQSVVVENRGGAGGSVGATIVAQAPHDGYTLLLGTMAGIETSHIPYRGSAPMMTDLIGGRIQFAFDGVATTVGYIRSGTVRSLGVSSAKRSAVLPDVPTIAESAVPGFEADAWF